jgi:Domain of unknown function (DUF4349)
LQHDLIAELREARPVAPVELREHVLRIAASAAPARPRITWRRALAVGIPVAAALAAAAVLLPSSGRRTATPQPTPERAKAQAHGSVPSLSPAVAPSAVALPANATAAGAGSATATVPRPTPGRVQRYSATLALHVPSTKALSNDTKEAVQIARALGGFASSVVVDTSGRTGYATIVLRIPKQNVQRAVTRLSAFGTIVGEHVSVQDLQAQVNATTAKIGRLERRLAALKLEPQTDQIERQIAALTARIATLGRGRASTIHAAKDATVHIELSTRPTPPPARPAHHHGPLHGLVVALRWAGIGAVYAIALGAPIVILALLVWLVARLLRRRREDALLSRS